MPIPRLDPLVCLSAALHGAANLHLPAVTYDEIDREGMGYPTVAELKKSAARPVIRKSRRPRADECFVLAMFAEAWGSTSLGFGGVGGAAITAAYTVAIQGPGEDIVVYWGSRFAFLIPRDTVTHEQQADFLADLRAFSTAHRREAASRYGAVWATGVR